MHKMNALQRISLALLLPIVAIATAGCTHEEFSEQMISGKWTQKSKRTVETYPQQQTGSDLLTPNVRWRFKEDGSGVHRPDLVTEYPIAWSLIDQETIVIEETRGAVIEVDTLELIWGDARAFKMRQSLAYDSLYTVEYTYSLEKGW